MAKCIQLSQINLSLLSSRVNGSFIACASRVRFVVARLMLQIQVSGELLKQFIMSNLLFDFLYHNKIIIK